METKIVREENLVIEKLIILKEKVTDDTIAKQEDVSDLIDEIIEILESIK